MLEPAARANSALRKVFDAARERLCADVLAGELGTVACGRLAASCDRLVTTALPDGAVPEGIALVATGGWGRREMCPQSDLDLLILAGDSARAHEFAERLLYPLWDAGIKVGHAVRAPDEMETLARQDVKTATALLDARLVAGDERLFEALTRARRRAVAPGGDPTRFVGQLVDERDRRHRRFGDSIYLLEPNIKHGIGALRDLATALWVAQVRFGRVVATELVRAGQLTRRQADVLVASREFFLRVRSLIQGHTKRASDQLSFEVQEAIGPVLYPEAKPSAHKPAVAPAVEALMGAYYLHARGVTGVMAQLFEAALTSRRRRPSVVRLDSSFLLFSGKLSAVTADVFDGQPAEMMRAFRLGSELGVPIHWHTTELIAERSHGEESILDLTADPVAGEHFMDALVDLRDRGAPTLLEQMHRVGLIAAVIPEFAACTGRVQHDLYHVYTVDQHQLHAVNMLKRIARAEEHVGVVSSIYSELTDVRAVFLATLLHDVGKPLGKGHSESGAVIARAAAIRFGFDSASADRTALLVRHHLTMSHISQRRDLSDPAVIRRFADHVGNLTTLRELLLLTVCDAAMTSPGNLSQWKLKLLLELYQRTRSLLGGDLPADGVECEDTSARTRERAAAMLADRGHALSAGLVAALDDHVASALSHRQLYRLLSLADQLSPDCEFAASLRNFPLKGHSEVAVLARDQRGLLAEVTEALAVAGISVEGAVIGSMTRDGVELATDLFFVRSADGKALAPNDPRWPRFCDEMQSLLRGEQVHENRVVERIDARRRSGLPPRVTPEVLTQISFAKDASTSYTVLEVFTQDAPGLLSDIARTLASEEVDIHLAKVSTEGERAADVFYIVDGTTGAPLDGDKRDRVKNALSELLE